jgi:molybdate transport system ATP-binding protein
LLSIEDLGLRLGSLSLDVSLDVLPERCLALVGPSGAGKTTLLRCVAGLQRPDRGVIRCDGRTWFEPAGAVAVPPESRRCAYVFQDYALFGHLSAWRNVAYPLRVGSRDERRRRALELLDRFGVADLAEARPRTLSGGERQRVALARALAREPSALLLDEPLAALDARTRGHAARELGRTVAAAGVPSILVTHDFEDAAALADEIAVVDAGSVVQRGTPGELASRPASAFVAGLIGSVVLTGRAAARPGGGTDVLLEGGGRVASTDEGFSGDAAVSVHPWEITLEPSDAAGASSARNRLAVRVASVTELGSRVRVGLDHRGQALAAEVTPAAVAELGLAPGREAVAVWKASATRVVER